MSKTENGITEVASSLHVPLPLSLEKNSAVSLSSLVHRSRRINNISKHIPRNKFQVQILITKKTTERKENIFPASRASWAEKLKKQLSSLLAFTKYLSFDMNWPVDCYIGEEVSTF